MILFNDVDKSPTYLSFGHPLVRGDKAKPRGVCLINNVVIYIDFIIMLHGLNPFTEI